MLHKFIALAVLVLASSAQARLEPYPASFRGQQIQTNATKRYVRVGGDGPAVGLLHGCGDSGDMGDPIAAELVKTGTVIVPDLLGIGLCDHPNTGYTEKNEAVDLAGVMDALKIDKADLHDIGNMVGYALAAQYPQHITKWVAIDAPLPSVDDWASQRSNPKTSHFNFQGPDEERLVAERGRTFRDRFYNKLSDDPKRGDEQTCEHHAALYARPPAMHDALEHLLAFAQDRIDNRVFLAKGKLTMPVLALGGEKSYGAATEFNFVAANVKGGIVPALGHWIMEENPAATTKRVTDFPTQWHEGKRLRNTKETP